MTILRCVKFEALGSETPFFYSLRLGTKFAFKCIEGDL